MKAQKAFLIVILMLALASFMACSQESLLNNNFPPGKHIEASETNLSKDWTFTEDQKLVATYYFYWYTQRRPHLTHHPPSKEGFNFRNIEWHMRQLKNMSRAGIDIILPVYWGNTTCKDRWSVVGLKKLVQAYDKLEGQNYDLPKIGMFYDTSALESEKLIGNWTDKPDLTAQSGKEFFYLMIRDFYSLIPPRMRARIEGKPIVWLYVSSYARDYSQNTIQFVNRKFSKEFGSKDLYIVRESSWTVNTENVYSWGAALEGPKFDGVYTVGPGYDDSAVPDRDTPVRERRGGEYYRDSWKKILALTDKTDNHTVAIETWNEYHEGTEIAPSAEHGKKYLKITKEYVNKFKSEYVPENFPGEKLIEVERASIDFSSGNIRGTGIKYVEWADGKNKLVEEDSSYCLKPKETEYSGKHMYFQVDPLFKKTKNSSEYKLKVEYYDSVYSEFRVQYDSSDYSKPHGGAYKSKDILHPLGTLTWGEVTINLDDVNFNGRQNGRADFRILAIGEEICIKSISLEPK